MVGCARVIGLEDNYYTISADFGSGGANLAGAGGNGGTSDKPPSGGEPGTGGEAGTVSSGLCADHPITAKSTWFATASHAYSTDPPSHLTDGMPARWSTGKPQSGDEWLRIDFGATVSLRSITLEQRANSDSNDYPRMYAVYLSDTDQDTGTACTNGVGSSGVSTSIVLPKVSSGRYLLIKQLGVSVSWWSVDELDVSCSEQ